MELKIFIVTSESMIDGNVEFVISKKGKVNNMKINEIKETREIVVRTEYVAKDGTVFYNEEECKKYEKTCRCVLMTDYRRLVKGNINEYDLFYENGCSDYKYDIVEVKTETDREIVNRVLVDAYEQSKLIEEPGMYLIYINDYEGGITGYWTTIDTILAGIRKVYDEAIAPKKTEQ